VEEEGSLTSSISQAYSVCLFLKIFTHQTKMLHAVNRSQRSCLITLMVQHWERLHRNHWLLKKYDDNTEAIDLTWQLDTFCKSLFKCIIVWLFVFLALSCYNKYAEMILYMLVCFETLAVMVTFTCLIIYCCLSPLQTCSSYHRRHVLTQMFTVQWWDVICLALWHESLLSVLKFLWGTVSSVIQSSKSLEVI